MKYLTFEEAASIETDSKAYLNKPLLYKKNTGQTAKLLQVDMVIRGEGYDLLYSFDNSRKLSAKDFIALNKASVKFSHVSSEAIGRLWGESVE
ncbi:hypothetical protein [Foetidibacter luteolus]|uniref:hypothetical protein n=1 Tax=Foetidibacter luteolus TaxID=2608880 RepID=UPI00129C04FD|nr:hypothetical protein [Foetidibacter luteolus]